MGSLSGMFRKINLLLAALVMGGFLAFTGCHTHVHSTFVPESGQPAPTPVKASAAHPATETKSTKLKLHALFSDNMVLQQSMSVPVWGWAPDGEIVTVSFRDQKIS